MLLWPVHCFDDSTMNICRSCSYYCYCYYGAVLPRRRPHHVLILSVRPCTLLLLCSARRVSQSPARPRPSTQSPARRLTPTATSTLVTGRVKTTESRPLGTQAVSQPQQFRPPIQATTGPSQATAYQHQQQYQEQSAADNPYAVKLQRETEAILRSSQTMPSTSNSTKLRTFSCGSVCC